MITSIDHLGIAVRSLADAVPLYENALGLKCLGREDVPAQKVRTAFFDAGGVQNHDLVHRGDAMRAEAMRLCAILRAAGLSYPVWPFVEAD